MGIFDEAKNKASEAAKDGSSTALDKEDFAKDKVGEEHADRLIPHATRSTLHGSNDDK